MKPLVLVALLVPALASAAQTVAVMPFKDLSGAAKGSIGEAIRETVTSDLKDVPGLKVIERGFIDKVLAEQNLQAERADLDPLASVKIGKLLGATMIVAGAYQKAASTVRLTARFVKVETGEIVGSAKVDGSNSDFLSLQDRVTVELLKSAGIEAKQVQRFAARPRAKLKSLRPVELYGDAVVEQDDKKREEMLRLAVNEDPNFVYAARDLDALEQRLKALDAQAKRQQEKHLAELREKLKGTTDADERFRMYNEMLTGMLTARRFASLVTECRAMLAGPPQPRGKLSSQTLEEICGFYIITGLSSLRQRDALLVEGEKFLARFPSSMYFSAVKGQMQMAIDWKRKVEDGKTKAEEDLKRLSSRDRWDLCHVARTYQYAHQYREAQRLYRACVEVGTPDRPLALFNLFNMHVELGEWKEARAVYKELEKIGDKQWFKNAQLITSTLPTDV